jgi:hypothetical protein
MYRNLMPPLVCSVLAFVTFFSSNVQLTHNSFITSHNLSNEFAIINISEAQSALINRIKSSKYINNPYKNLNSSQSKMNLKDEYFFRIF